jgi:hypothetical protein
LLCASLAAAFGPRLIGLCRFGHMHLKIYSFPSRAIVFRIRVSSPGMQMTRHSLEPCDDATGADGPVSPWRRALLGFVAVVLLLVAHALPHLG